MSDRIGFEDPRLQRMEQATLWLQRMRAAGPDDRVVEAWLDWCQSDPLNQQAFDEIAAVWEHSARLPREPVAAVRRTGTSRRALVASLAGLGLACAGGGAWWWQARDAALISQLSSPVGVNTVKKLADGSVLSLGGGTRVTVTLGATARRIQLHEGQLFVAVHHDTSRPFTVVSGELEVLATGTQFDVLRSPARTTVTVTEGSVAAFDDSASAATNLRLQTGQRLIYSHALHSFDVRQVDPARAVGWRSGMLYYENEPMAEIIATLNRYTARSVVLADNPRISQLTYTGTVDIRLIESWVALMPNLFPFRVGMTNLAGGRRLLAPEPNAVPD